MSPTSSTSVAMFSNLLGTISQRASSWRGTFFDTRTTMEYSPVVSPRVIFHPLPTPTTLGNSNSWTEFLLNTWDKRSIRVGLLSFTSKKKPGIFLCRERRKGEVYRWLEQAVDQGGIQ